MRKEPLKEESPPSPDGATKSTYAKAVIIGEDPTVDYRAERKIRLEKYICLLGRDDNPKAVSFDSRLPSIKCSDSKTK